MRVNWDTGEEINEDKKRETGEVYDTQSQIDQAAADGNTQSIGEEEAKVEAQAPLESAREVLRKPWPGIIAAEPKSNLDYFWHSLEHGLGASLLKGFGNVVGEFEGSATATEIIQEVRSAETQEFIDSEPEADRRYYAWVLTREHAEQIKLQLQDDRATHEAFADEQWYRRWPIQIAAAFADPASYVLGSAVAPLTKPVQNALLKMAAFSGAYSASETVLKGLGNQEFSVKDCIEAAVAGAATGMILSAGSQVTKKSAGKLYEIVKERIASTFKPVDFDIYSGRIGDIKEIAGRSGRVNWITALQAGTNLMTPIQEGLSSSYKTINNLTQRLLSTGGMYYKGQKASRGSASAMDRTLAAHGAYLKHIQELKRLELEFKEANANIDRRGYFDLLRQINGGATLQEFEGQGIKDASILFDSHKLSLDFLRKASRDLYYVKNHNVVGNKPGVNSDQLMSEAQEWANKGTMENASQYLTSEEDIMAPALVDIPYRPRIYDRVEVKNKEKEVKSLFEKGFLRQLIREDSSHALEVQENAAGRKLHSGAKTTEVIKKSGETHPKIRPLTTEKMADFTLRARAMAKTAWEDIVGLGEKRPLAFHVEGLKESQMSKERSILIDDRLLNKLGILVTDPYREAHLIQAHVIPYINTKKALIEAGFRDFGEVRNELKAEFDKARLKAGKDKVKTDRLERQWRHANDKILPDLEDIAQNGLMLRDDMNFSPKVEILANFYRTINYTRMLGKLPISQLVDLSDIVRRFGLPGTLKEVIATFRPMKRTGADLLTNLELKDLAVACEVENIRVRRLMEQSFVDTRDFEMVLPGTEVGPISNALDKVGRGIGYAHSIVNLAAHMNDWSKRIVGRMLLSDVTRSLMKPYSALTKEEMKRLAELRINKATHAGMKAQIERFGEEYEGTIIPHVNRWEDEKLAEHFRAEAISFVNKTIMTPTQADVPIALNRKWGKLLFMFRRFAFARTQHYFQNPNMPLRENMLTWIPTSISLSGLSVALKYLGSGKEIDPTDMRFYYRIFEESGVVSNFASMLMHMVESGYNVVAGKSGRGDVEDIARKEMPFLNDVADATEALVKTFNGKERPWSEYEMNKFKQIFPFNGLWYFSPFVQYGIHQNRRNALAKTYKNTWW
jgi:hypothetical protein